MANMSYCRFHNTNMDMRDCIDAHWIKMEIGMMKIFRKYKKNT